MTKKALLERIEKIEEVIGQRRVDLNLGLFDFTFDEVESVGWRMRNIEKEIDKLRETQNLLLKYLKVQVKEIPEQPAKKEIVPVEQPIIGGFDIDSVDMGSTTSCCIAADELSTPPQPQRSKNPKKRTLRK